MTSYEDAQFDPPIESGLVVGHDGSGHGDAALAFAVKDALRRGCPLHIVRAWVLSTAARDVAAPFGTVPSYAECEENVLAQLAHSVATSVPADLPVPVYQHVLHGPPAQALIAASQHAELLVVGHRGRGGFVGLVLGSTAEQVLRHAHCPVVVVRS